MRGLDVRRSKCYLLWTVFAFAGASPDGLSRTLFGSELQLLQFETQAIDDADQALLINADNKERKTRADEAVRPWECFKQQTETDPRQSRKLEIITKLRRLMKEQGMLV